MKKATFSKTNLVDIKTPPSGHVAVWVDNNNVFTSVDSNGANIALGALININTQTGTTYSFVLSDGGKLVEMNNSATNSVTLPSNANVPFAVGTQILLTQYGAGQTGLTFASPVTVRSTAGKLKLNGQYTAGTLVKRGTNEWYFFGDITT